MKKTTLILMLFCSLGITLKSMACSPVLTPFKEWLDSYNKNKYVIVEGYFLPAIGKNYYATKLKVMRSSDPSIKIGKEYEVFEYGPFGSMCEMYEMKANIKPELVGQKKPRLLIVYKDRSINNKLVTPIFWEAGVNVSNNKVVTKKYDFITKQHVFYECPITLDEIWKQILKGSGITSKWKKTNL